MPRHHTIWDSELKQQVNIDFTAEEEAARDAEEAQIAIEMAAAKERRERQEVLDAKLADDSITFEEMKELMRLRG